MATVERLKALLNDPASSGPDDLVYGRNWNQWCQALMYQLTRLVGAPNPPNLYLSAMAARLASGWLNPDATAAPAGAIHFWMENHVGLGLGGETVLMASYAIDNAWVPNGTAGDTTVSRYTARKGLTYAGWAVTDGGNVIPVESGASPVLGAGQRLTKGAPVNRRSGPATTYPSAGAQLAANTVGNFIAFAHAQSVTIGGVTTDVWYQGISKAWFWAGLFTSIDGTGLADLSSQFGSDGQVVAAGTPGPVVVIPTYVAPYVISSRGIDVATGQAGIDFAAVVAGTAEWAIVKAGGANADLYVAPFYGDELDAARAAGLQVGHYFNTGQTDPAAAAIFFVANLHDFDVNADVLMLDNEPYPGDLSGQLWNPGQAAVFLAKVIELTGIDPKRVWHYTYASKYRGISWLPVTALGVRYAWSSFGSAPYPTDFSPTAVPDLQASIPDWDVHQFSSNGQLGGKTVDLWASRLSTADLFAKGTVVVQGPPVVIPPPIISPPPVVDPPIVVPPVVITPPPVLPPVDVPPVVDPVPPTIPPVALGKSSSPWLTIVAIIGAIAAAVLALFFGH
jgi:hypothetical protein